MKSSFSVALVAAIAQSADVNLYQQRARAFNSIIATSTLNGKPLHSQIPAVKNFMKPVVAQADGEVVGEGCEVYDDGYVWSRDFCGQWCIDGYLDDLGREVCPFWTNDYDSFCENRPDQCGGDEAEDYAESSSWMAQLEEIGAMILENAQSNGLDVEAAAEWLQQAQQAWEDLEREQQDAADELAKRKEEELVEQLAPVISGMADDLEEAVIDGLNEAVFDLQSQLDMFVNGGGEESEMNVEFINMLMRSKVDGKPLTTQVPALKQMIRPRRVLQEAVSEDEFYLGEGCQVWSGNGYWHWSPMEPCGEWCVYGWFNSEDMTFDCGFVVSSESQYECERWGNCQSDFERAIEAIGEMVMESAMNNGFDPEAAEQWMADTNAEWEQLYADSQKQDEELFMQQIAEVNEEFGPVIDGMIIDAQDALANLLDGVREEIDEARDDENAEVNVVLAEKKVQKHKSQHTAAYVAGGITLAAAAVGAVYLLKKRQEQKTINEALIGGDYARSSAIL